MTIGERIRKYIQDAQNSGALKPGDRLPSVPQFCQICDGSYASTQKALKNLEREGVIEIVHGNGAFLKGRSRLAVDFFMDCGSFYPLRQFQDELNRELEKRQLYLEVNLRDFVLENFAEPVLSAEKRFAVIAQDDWNTFPGNLMDYANFADYGETIEQLNEYDLGFRSVRIPYYTFLYQPAINPQFMKRIDFDRELEFTDLRWWDQYLEQCRKFGCCPASEHWQIHALWNFQFAFSRILPLVINERRSREELLRLPFFNTDAGRRGLHIMGSHTLLPDTSCGFFRGEEGVCLMMGTWISRQMGGKFKLKPEELRIVANRLDGRKICQHRLFSLRTFMYPGVTEDEQRRIWEFIKVLVSKPLQKCLADCTGCVSVRRDMKPADHPWVTREDYLEFFPEKGDRTISIKLLSPELTSALSTLFERYKFYGEALDDIAQCMDEKMKSIWLPT